MRVGILECDHVEERHRSIAGDYSDMFRALLAGHLPDAEIVAYDASEGELPGSPEECDAWLCTGSRASVYDPLDWIADLAGFVGRVREAGAPYVGICFGHQMLAHALGGCTERAEHGWGVGAHRLEVGDEGLRMGLRPATLLYTHQDQVTRLPADAAVLASTAHCRVAALAVGTSMVGFQAHPEFPASYLEALLAERAERIGTERTEAALRSLSEPTDEAAVASWIAGVLRGRA